MKISKMPGFGSYGTIVDDFDWNNPDSYKELRDINLKSLVTVVRGHNQNNFDALTKHAYNTFVPRTGAAKWLLKYGPDWPNKLSEAERSSQAALSDWTAGLENYPGWSRVSGKKNEQGKPIGAFGETELLWHVDEPGSDIFYPLVVLYGAAHMETSATCFVQTADWYEQQTESFRSELNELVAVYDMTRTQYGIDEENRDIIIANQSAGGNNNMPLVVKSPGGITGIRYARQIAGFEGMSQVDSDRLLDKIRKEIFVPEYNYDFWWEHDHGDLLLMDNSITVHQRKIREEFDMRTELNQRIAYKVIADYADSDYYNPYIHDSFKGVRQQKLSYVKQHNQLVANHWPMHLPKLKKLNLSQRVEYIKRHVAEKDRDKILAELMKQ